MPTSSRFISLLGSKKLALGLLLVISAVCALGTIIPQERIEASSGTGAYPGVLTAVRWLAVLTSSRSPFFLGLLSLLALNIVFCTLRRWPAAGSASAPGAFRTRSSARLWLDGGMHLAIIVVLAGGLVRGLFGFIGTQYLFTNSAVKTVYDWGTKSEVPLGFTVRLEEKIELYYPIRAKIGVSDLSSGRKIALVETVEGQRTAVPGEALSLQVVGTNQSESLLQVKVNGGGEDAILGLETARGGKTSAAFGTYNITLVKYRRDLLNIKGLVTILEGEKVVQRSWFYPNSPVHYQGTRIFTTTWGADDSGNEYIGVQVTRDPGQPIFWTGAVLFCLVLPLFLWLRHGKKLSPDASYMSSR